MKRLIYAALALCLAAGSADARALVIRSHGYNANTETGASRLMEVTLSMLNTLGADYHTASIEDAAPWSTDGLRRGVWYRGGSVNSDSATYNPIIIVGDNAYANAQVLGTVHHATSASGYAAIDAAAGTFTYIRPGMLITSSRITGAAVVVSVDSLGGKIRVRGTVNGGDAAATASFGARLDSLTLVAAYPKVTIIRIGNHFDAASFQLIAGACSTGTGGAVTYSSAAGHDSIWNVYEIGNPYRSWKSRQRTVASATRDARGFRPLLGALTTRQNTVGYAGGNYDFPDPVCSTCAYSTNPDTVGPVWAILNNGSGGTPLGGDAKPNVYCIPSVTFANSIEPSAVLIALALGDSLSGGGLFGTSERLPRKFGIHIDDSWRRGDSRFGNAVGLIATDDTTAFKASIDSLASLQVPLVTSYEPESLATVLLSGPSPYVTGDGRYYDQRWWARNPYAHYTPHAHSGAGAVANIHSKIQNTGTIGTNGYTGKFIRTLDIFGVSRQRYAFGSVDSMLAYGLPDYQNDIADTGAVYWIVKRAFALGDSVFGRDKVDRLIMPAGDDWTITGTKHTRFRQHGLGNDSTVAALLAAGAVGTRTNNNNAVGNDDSTVTNNYGYYPGWKRISLSHQAGGPGMPTWLPASMYGRSFEILPTAGYPGGSGTSGLVNSVSSWSHNRASFGGDAFLLGLLCDRSILTGDPGGQRAIYILSSHASDYGSSGRTGEETRPQFYTTKYVMNQIRVANAHALRDLVQCVYPQDVRP